MTPIINLLFAFGLLSIGTVSAIADTVDTAATILPNNPAILYVGRWDTTDPSTYHSYWGGAYLRTNFTGTSVAIRIADNEALVVSIDGEAPRGINAVAGVNPLNQVPLKAGNHTLLVGSAGQNYEVQLQGLVFDAGAAVTAPAPKPIIEFIGDSTTTFGGPDGSTIANYAWNTAEALGCDHTQISFSGVALTSGYGCLSFKTGQDVQYFKLKNFNHLDSTTDWDSTRYTPAIIVINLGQNDQCGQEPQATMSASMTSFVQKIRKTFPQTQIVVLRPFSGAYGATEEDAVRQLIFDGDQRLLFVDTSKWLTPADFNDGVQPNGVGNLKVLSRLAPILRAVLPAS